MMEILAGIILGFLLLLVLGEVAQGLGGALGGVTVSDDEQFMRDEHERQNAELLVEQRRIHKATVAYTRARRAEIDAAAATKEER